MCLVMLRLDVPEWSGTQGGLSFTEERLSGQLREGFVKVGLGGKEGEEEVIEV